MLILCASDLAESTVLKASEYSKHSELVEKKK